jgi:hypothetical protein
MPAAGAESPANDRRVELEGRRLGRRAMAEDGGEFRRARGMHLGSGEGEYIRALLVVRIVINNFRLVRRNAYDWTN